MTNTTELRARMAALAELLTVCGKAKDTLARAFDGRVATNRAGRCMVHLEAVRFHAYEAEADLDDIVRELEAVDTMIARHEEGPRT